MEIDQTERVAPGSLNSEAAVAPASLRTPENALAQFRTALRNIYLGHAVARDLDGVLKMARGGHGLGLYGAVMDFEDPFNSRVKQVWNETQQLLERQSGDTKRLTILEGLLRRKVKAHPAQDNLFVLGCFLALNSQYWPDPLKAGTMRLEAAQLVQAAAVYEVAIQLAADAALLIRQGLDKLSATPSVTSSTALVKQSEEQIKRSLETIVASVEAMAREYTELELSFNAAIALNGVLQELCERNASFEPLVAVIRNRSTAPRA